MNTTIPNNLAELAKSVVRIPQKGIDPKFQPLPIEKASNAGNLETEFRDIPQEYRSLPVIDSSYTELTYKDSRVGFDLPVFITVDAKDSKFGEASATNDFAIKNFGDYLFPQTLLDCLRSIASFYDLKRRTKSYRILNWTVGILAIVGVIVAYSNCAKCLLGAITLVGLGLFLVYVVGHVIIDSDNEKTLVKAKFFFKGAVPNHIREIYNRYSQANTFDYIGLICDATEKWDVTIDKNFKPTVTDYDPILVGIKKFGNKHFVFFLAKFDLTPNESLLTREFIE